MMDLLLVFLYLFELSWKSVLIISSLSSVPLTCSIFVCVWVYMEMTFLCHKSESSKQKLTFWSVHSVGLCLRLEVEVKFCIYIYIFDTEYHWLLLHAVASLWYEQVLIFWYPAFLASVIVHTYIKDCGNKTTLGCELYVWPVLLWKWQILMFVVYLASCRVSRQITLHSLSCMFVTENLFE